MHRNKLHQALSSNAAVLSAALALSACGGGDGSGDSDGGTGVENTPKVVVPAKLAIVADWLNRSLSYVDVDALATGATRDAVVTSTISLPDDAPGPLEVALTPDKKTALVTVSAGFFSIPLAGTLIGANNLPTDPGKLLFLDVDSGKVTGEIALMSPTGIAITPDGARAFVTNFSSSNMVIVDLASKAVTSTVTLDVYPEEIVFDETGTVGILGDSAQGSAHTFSVADPANTLTPVVLDGDSAGLAFFPGTKVAFMVQAPNPLSLVGGFSVIDVSDPKAPKLLQDERLDPAPIGYPATAAKNRQSVLVPTTVEGRLVLREYKLQDGKAILGTTIDIEDATLLSALGIAYDGDHTALIAWPRQRALVAVDLNAGTSKVIPWLIDQPGPAGAVFR